MAKLRHVAISVNDPEASAKFFESAFGMWRVGSARRGVHMTDGVVNVALLNFGTDTIPGQEERPGMKGLIHFGMWVDDLMETNVAIVAAGGTYMSGPLDGATTEPDGYYEVKYATPDGIVFDTTATGWRGAAKDVVPALETAQTKS